MLSRTLSTGYVLFSYCEFIFLFLLAYFRLIMGRHQKRRRSAKAIATECFPVGELAKRRKKIREEYIANCELLQQEDSELKKLSTKVIICV